MGDRFFVSSSSARKRPHSRSRAPDNTIDRTRRNEDDDITSESDASGGEDFSEVESESDHETETDKRRRLAKEYLASLETELVDGFDAKNLDEDIISRRLKQDAAEQQGHIFRDLTTAQLSAVRKTRTPQSRHLTCVATGGKYCYVGAKDGSLSKWTIVSGEDNTVKAKEHSRVLCNTPTLDRQTGSSILCISVNTANKLLAVGFVTGFAVYNAENLKLLREFRIRGKVLSIVFRRGTSELYVGASDLRLRTYDLAQWAFVETLHGHQDEIMSLSALNQERCVSVGARDRTVIFWKIPEESRLTFRGGDTKLAAKVEAVLKSKHNNVEEKYVEEKKYEEKKDDFDPYTCILEGSIDCCAMLDHQLFISGSDNGNLALWSTNKKKPQSLVAQAHGMNPNLDPNRATGESDLSKAEIPPALPRPVTALAAVPYSNTWFSGSTDGTICMWALDEEKRSFNKVGNFDVGQGIVTGMCVAELGKEFAVIATLSREPRLGRWLVTSGRDQIVSFKVSPN